MCCVCVCLCVAVSVFSRVPAVGVMVLFSLSSPRGLL